MSTAAFIGLGAMGSRMAANLIKAGHQVTVCDLDPKAVQKLAAIGAKTAATAREAAKGNEFVIAMVRDDDISRTIWLDANSGALAGMDSGAVAIECSTLTPGWVRELGKTFKDAKHALLEAPVSGSTPQAQDAQLVFLVGGDQKTMELAEPLLKAMGSAVTFAGPAGAGALAKLVTNTFMGVQLSILAQMIKMLRKEGIGPKQVLDAVATTPLWNPHLTSDAESMLKGNFEPHFPIKLLLKDLNYTVQTAGGEQSVPTVSEVRDLFKKAVDEKLGDLNMTAVIKLFER